MTETHILITPNPGWNDLNLHGLRRSRKRILNLYLDIYILYSIDLYHPTYDNITYATLYFPPPPQKPGRVAQSVTYLATDACLTADPGVASSIPARYHTFVEIDHEIISTVILLPSADLFKKGCCQLQAKVCAQITS